MLSQLDQPFRQYVKSFYWSITVLSTVGFGDVVPYTWQEEHTPREKWLGGFKKDGENYTTRDALDELLGEHFSLVGEPGRMPFVIRETTNKYQYNFTDITIWERKA